MPDIEPRRICIVIAAYNEESVIGDVIRELLTENYQVVVVDDGSSDKTYDLCLGLPIHLLRHPINQGYGGAQQTGFKYASLLPDVDVIVTYDADGQHVCEEIPKLVAPIIEGQAEVTLGSRFLGVTSERMPAAKRLLLRAAVLFTRLTTGLQLTDTHNGFRAFSQEVVKRMRLTQSGMAYGSELLGWIAQSRFRYVEIPVRVRYTEYSIRKGQSIWNMFNILVDLIVN